MKKIKYVENIKQENFEGQVIKCPEYAYVEIETSYVKRYRSYIYALLNLKLSHIHTIECLVDFMDNDNMVTTNKVTRDKIIKTYYTLSKGEINYSDATIKSAVKKLVDENLLIKKQRGVYTVNPYYFFKGSEYNREKLIRIILQIEKGTEDILKIEK